MNAARAKWSNTDLQQDVSEAEWVDYNLDGVATTTVGSLVPTVFDAYARIQYPGRNGTPNLLSRAKTVAAWHVSWHPSPRFSLEARKHPTNAGSPSGKATRHSMTFA
ncbi:hypothetical protein CH252_28585 [Rhodococcus sp. 06-1477-1B]|nr:hypothetical protein CH252_28585 [Rhodococcus sp. 06-1477-1B]OZD54353.1 hypothetical protein CH266_03070 [Rhodococcus sp. 06-1474-1B]